MSCDYPIKCPYFNEEQKRKTGSGCTFDFEGNPNRNPCEEHQMHIDDLAMREMARAIRRGDYKEAKSIANSPFTSFRR